MSKKFSKLSSMVMEVTHTEFGSIDEHEPNVEQESKVVNLTKKVLNHMINKTSGNLKGGLLLGGSPGIGKTSSVKMISKLLGIECVVVEVPHIVDEYLVNIPFLILDPKTNKIERKTSNIKTDSDEDDSADRSGDVKLVVADSYLYTELNNAKKVSDEEYLSYMYNKQSTNANIRALFEALGGNKTTIPSIIQQARKSCNCILFLDEFYRSTTKRIRNILRGLLDHRLGAHKIKSSVYCIYASNMVDEGLDSVMQNEQFLHIEYEHPTKDEWFKWVVNEYKGTDNEINQSVVDILQESLQDEDISFDDFDADVRTSPRRWEQLVLLINSGVPVSSQQEGEQLLRLVKNNFVSGSNDTHSVLAKKVLLAVIDIIKETSDIKVGNIEYGDVEDQTKQAERIGGDINDLHGEWRDSLSHYIKLQMKSGVRKYFPVLSGLPGIGKTTSLEQIATDNNMVLVDINTALLLADDVTGIPMRRDSDSSSVQIKFAMSQLYRTLMNRIKEEKSKHVQELRDSFPGNEGQQKVKEFEQQKFKYIIFFDELSRVDTKTFNALRRVLLEKDFGRDDTGKERKLPDGCLFIGAMNPDGQGVTSLTKHFRDVIDIIPVAPSWKKTVEYLHSKISNISGADLDIKKKCIELLEIFTNHFKLEKSSSSDQTNFHLSIDGVEVYLSPRVFDDICVNLVMEMDEADNENQQKTKRTTEDKIKRFKKAILNALLPSMIHEVGNKNNISPADVKQSLVGWIMNINRDFYNSLVGKYASHNYKLSDLLSEYFSGKIPAVKIAEDTKIPYLISSIGSIELQNEIGEAYRKAINSLDIQTQVENLLDKKYKPYDIDSDFNVVESNGEKESQMDVITLLLVRALKSQGMDYDTLIKAGNFIITEFKNYQDSIRKRIRATLNAPDSADGPDVIKLCQKYLPNFSGNLDQSAIRDMLIKIRDAGLKLTDLYISDPEILKHLGGLNR